MTRAPKGSRGWREPILECFSPAIASVARLTVVADPDQLLTEQGVQDGIRRRGFDIIPFDDHVAFRFAFESRYRQIWDGGDATNLVVVLRAEKHDVDELPFDLLEQARRHQRVLSFSVAELFPHLSPPVVCALDRADLDDLFEAQQTHDPGPLGDNATKDFILRHVFKVAPEMIASAADLLQVLIRRHYQSRQIPPSLDERFISLLQQSGKWDTWPLADIVPHRAAFFAFLEERWPLFLRRVGAEQSKGASEPTPPYGLKFSGPADLPFDHDEVHVLMDNLFTEGHLAPSEEIPKDAVRGTWMEVGVVGDETTDTLDRLDKLITRVDEEFPTPDARHDVWIQTAFRWADATAMRWKVVEELPAGICKRYDDLHDRVEYAFAEWMVDHYASLLSVPYLPRPATLNNVLNYLQHQQNRKRLALVVVDGIALDQWVIIREDLVSWGQLEVETNAVFAMVPTLTSISRQSIFAAKLPMNFAGTIKTTSTEKDHWSRFWRDNGARTKQMDYLCQGKKEDEAKYLQRIKEAAEHSICRYLGIVVGTVDQTVHGTVLGTGGLHAEVRHWVAQGRFRKIIQTLLDEKYEVWVTSDHGNIDGTGIGKPDVGAIAENRGQRAQIFRDEGTRTKTHAQFPEAIVWQQSGIPDDMRAMLAPGRGAFIPEGKRAVAHGGISVEEVIVPLARISEKS